MNMDLMYKDFLCRSNKSKHILRDARIERKKKEKKLINKLFQMKWFFVFLVKNIEDGFKGLEAMKFLFVLGLRDKNVQLINIYIF